LNCFQCGRYLTRLHEQFDIINSTFLLIYTWQSSEETIYEPQQINTKNIQPVSINLIIIIIIVRRRIVQLMFIYLPIFSPKTNFKVSSSKGKGTKHTRAKCDRNNNNNTCNNNSLYSENVLKLHHTFIHCTWPPHTQINLVVLILFYWDNLNISYLFYRYYFRFASLEQCGILDSWRILHYIVPGHK
jgi:hypothetical protein